MYQVVWAWGYVNKEIFSLVIWRLSRHKRKKAENIKIKPNTACNHGKTMVKRTCGVCKEPATVNASPRPVSLLKWTPSLAVSARLKKNLYAIMKKSCFAVIPQAYSALASGDGRS